MPDMVNRYLLIFVLYLIVALPSSARRKVVEDDGFKVKMRGVMESFPDIHEGFGDRLDFYSKVGMTHYFYCPSDDRYSNAWGWKFLYNDGDRHALKELRDECIRKGMDFVWTVSPGEGYGWDRKDYDFLLNKLVMMYYDGIRSFAVDFSNDTGESKALKDSLEVDFVARYKDKPDVFIVNHTPSVTFPSEEDAAKTVMKGYHFDAAYKDDVVRKGSMICVLKENSELAKMALMAVSDCARDPYGYDSDRSMSKGIEALSPDIQVPFATFLAHTGGVRESENIETFALKEWSEEKSQALLTEFRKIEQVPSQMTGCQSPVLLEALAPWLEEFGKLGARGVKVMECLDHYVKGDVGAFWISYIGNIMSDDDRRSFEKYSVGSVRLHPFYLNMMDELTEAFTLKLTGGMPLKNLASTLYVSPEPALDSDFTTSVSSSGHMEFPIPADANACRLLTGALPEGKTVLFRELGTDGKLVAEFVVTSPYSEFDLKEGAVKVDVLGDVDIYESIFVYL